MTVIRDAVAEDLPAIREIYVRHVLEGKATFEEAPPAPEEMAARWDDVRGRGLPWLVAGEDGGGRVLGYAYAAPYRLRSAYRFTLEDSIYLDPGATGRGIGRRLLDGLIDRSTAWGGRQMVAVIGDSGNAASIAVHARAGFTHAGLLRAVGFKFGTWVDVVLMQRPLGPGAGSLPMP